MRWRPLTMKRAKVMELARTTAWFPYPRMTGGSRIKKVLVSDGFIIALVGILASAGIVFLAAPTQGSAGKCLEFVDSSRTGACGAEGFEWISLLPAVATLILFGGAAFAAVWLRRRRRGLRYLSVSARPLNSSLQRRLQRSHCQVPAWSLSPGRMSCSPQ